MGFSEHYLQPDPSTAVVLDWPPLCQTKPAPHLWVLYLAGRLAYCRFVAYQWPWNRILAFSMTSPTNMTAFFPWPVHPWHAVYCIFSRCVKLKELWEGTPKCGGGGWGLKFVCFMCGMCCMQLDKHMNKAVEMVDGYPHRVTEADDT